MRYVYFTEEEYSELQPFFNTNGQVIISQDATPYLFKRLDVPDFSDALEEIKYALENPDSIRVRGDDYYSNLEILPTSRGYASTMDTSHFLAKNTFGNVVLVDTVNDEINFLEGYDFIFTINELVGLGIVEYINFIPEDEVTIMRILSITQPHQNEFIELKNKYKEVEDAINEIMNKGKGPWFEYFASEEISVDDFIDVWDNKIRLSIDY